MRTWLKEKRKLKGWTQKQAADESNISRPAYTNIENGERGVSAKVAKALGAALGFDWTMFYNESESDSKAEQKGA